MMPVSFTSGALYIIPSQLVRRSRNQENVRTVLCAPRPGYDAPAATQQPLDRPAAAVVRSRAGRGGTSQVVPAIELSRPKTIASVRVLEFTVASHLNGSEAALTSPA